MRRAVTFAVRGNRYESIFDPSVPFSEQAKWIKRAQHEGFACDCIEQWTSDGEKRKYHPPAPKILKLPKTKIPKLV